MKQVKNGITYTPESVVIDSPRVVQQIRFISKNAFIIRFNRDNLQFKAGQFVAVGVEPLQQREYSIYSGEKDDYIEILVREVLGGNVSQQLKQIEIGQSLLVSGPLGITTINEEDINSKRFVFIGSGTGISPFHSFITSYPKIDYTIIHGVRYLSEAYDKNDYDPQRYVLCTSREKGGNYYGRVTSFLLDFRIGPNTLFYVCGNSSMIYEVYDILRKKGVSMGSIHSEVYF
ncbi:MAG: oxidoreductase [Bacteroidales bacterium]|nr:MAG: oxidoreductase [Bacteroidales bacterium]